MIYNINNGFNILSHSVGWGSTLASTHNALSGVEMWTSSMRSLFSVAVVIGRESSAPVSSSERNSYDIS